MKLSNESYFSLNFMVRRCRPNKEGEFPILLRITMNGQRAEVYTNQPASLSLFSVLVPAIFGL